MSPSLADKVRFLLEPRAYPDPPLAVDSVETHFAWVFFTDRHAYKLKKPVHLQVLDFRELAARELDCREELRLNRRLAPDVYLQVVPLVLRPGGGLGLGGAGETVDWLVKMRRLPARLSLDQMLRSGTAASWKLRALAQTLAQFYRAVPPEPLTPRGYRARLTALVDDTHRELRRPQFVLDPRLVDGVREKQRAFLRAESPLLGERAAQRRIVEAHGDLRPEHIFVGAGLARPLIIDCLEFSRELRILDCADDLALLALECERRQAPQVGREILAEYARCSGDAPAERLVRFYQSLRAAVRAKLAIWHQLDPQVEPSPRWARQAGDYLALAEAYLEAA